MAAARINYARSRSGGSSLCVFSSGCGRPESPAPNDARFFYFSTAGAPVRAAEVSPVGVLMAAWAPNATRWRWILAFVSWGISLYRFCPLCWGKKAHRCGSTIGNGRGQGTPVPQRPSARFTTSRCCITNMIACLLFQLIWSQCGGHWQQDRTGDGKSAFGPVCYVTQLGLLFWHPSPIPAAWRHVCDRNAFVIRWIGRWQDACARLHLLLQDFSCTVTIRTFGRSAARCGPG